jgi:hypothetical protein
MGDHSYAQRRNSHFPSVLVRRLSAFSAIGAFVFAAGTALQGAIVAAGGGPNLSYLWQSVFSIELSFVLNQRFTWHDRDVRILPALTRWNLQKIALTAPNFLAYAALVHTGLNWLEANFAVTAAFTVINYVGGDLWSFAKSPAEVVPAPPSIPFQLIREPTVSVVVPCKNNAGTIRQTVDALLGQDYPMLEEVILVGSVGDSTWAPLAGITDPRLVILEQEATPGRRDPAVKRDKGLRKASGEILALADSDIVMHERWLSRAVGMLLGQGGGVVAGGMKSIHDTFWGRFVDRNRLGAKTPRVFKPYTVTPRNFGRHNRKPPVTANVVFTRNVYDTAPLDTAWAYGYEDYEWFWRVARAGHRILFSDRLAGAHHHRRAFRQLAREYYRAADGCARFVRAHPDCPLARKRRLQAITLPAAGATACAVAAATAVAGYGLELAAAAVLIMGGLMVHEYKGSRTAESLAYPVAASALGLVFTTGLVNRLLRPSDILPSPTGAHALPERQRFRSPQVRSRFPWALAAILALQAGLSLSLVWSNTAFGDEALYIWAGHLEWAHWLHGTSLTAIGRSVQFSDYFSGAPQIYPPLAALADSFGGLAAARCLSLVFMLGASVFLYLTTRSLFGRREALVATALWAVTEPELKTGAFATYDAMGICFLLMAAWIGVIAARRQRHAELIGLTALASVTGSVIAYSYVIYIPVVVALYVSMRALSFGWRSAMQSGAWMLACIVSMYLGLATVLRLWSGLLFTIYNRGGKFGIARQPISQILNSVWSWQGIIMCLGAVGAACALASGQKRLLVVLLAGASCVVPAEQLHLHTGVSLDKHLVPGVWFACIAAAYGVCVIVGSLKSRRLLATAGSMALAVPAITGYVAANYSFHGWNDEAAVIAEVSKLYGSTYDRGNILFEGNTPNPIRYGTGSGRNWVRWSELWVRAPSVLIKSSASLTLSEYRTSFAAANIQLAVFSFSAPSVDALANAEFLSDRRHRVQQTQFASEITSLLAGDPRLALQTEALDSDPAYRIEAVIPEGRNLSNIAAAVVVWERVSSPR